jgi:hypothetical protein
LKAAAPQINQIPDGPLSLNAGVVAARVEDGGRGFALWPFKCRLPWRSAAATKGIKALISTRPGWRAGASEGPHVNIAVNNRRKQRYG